MALSMPEAVEHAHMGHPDFRVHDRIFATLHAGNRSGMVKLTPDQQREFVREHPTSFAPENGAWGRQGCTRVQLDAVGEEALGEAMTLAWQNTSRKRAAGRANSQRPANPGRISRSR